MCALWVWGVGGCEDPEAGAETRRACLGRTHQVSVGGVREGERVSVCVTHPTPPSHPFHPLTLTTSRQMGKFDGIMGMGFESLAVGHVATPMHNLLAQVFDREGHREGGGEGVTPTHRASSAPQNHLPPPPLLHLLPLSPPQHLTTTPQGEIKEGVFTPFLKNSPPSLPTHPPKTHSKTHTPATGRDQGGRVRLLPGRGLAGGADDWRGEPRPVRGGAALHGPQGG